MNKRRVARMNEQLRREISEIVKHEARDPRISTVSLTVTDARVTPDMQQARIFVSVTGDEDEKAGALEGLAVATPFIRSALAARMELRRVPELIFMLDETQEYAMHIERLLHEVLPHGELPAAPSENDTGDDSTDGDDGDDGDDAAGDAGRDDGAR